MQITVAIISLVREFLKYLKTLEKSRLERAKKISNFSRAIKQARKTNDTTDIERSFNDLGFIVQNRTD